MLAEGSGQVDSAVAVVDGGVAGRLEAENGPRPAWLKCRMDGMEEACFVCGSSGYGEGTLLTAQWGVGRGGGSLL